MTQILGVLSSVLIVLAVGARVSSDAQQHPETGRAPDKGDYVNMRGCVNGSLLTSIRLDPGTVAGSLTGSNHYRMVGSKEIRKQLKKLDGKMVDVTGHLRIEDNRVMVKSKKSGKTTFTVGSAQGVQSPLQDNPVADATIDVVGVELVQTVCNAL